MRSFIGRIDGRFAILIALFLFLLVINIILPRQSDDFNHYYSALEGLKSAKNSYLNWNARIGELINNAFLAGINPYIFDVLNASVGTIFIVSFFILLFCRFPRDFKDFSIITLILFIIMYSCAFGSTFAWGAGSVNYLWGLCLILLFLLPWRFVLTSKFLVGGGDLDSSLLQKQFCDEILHFFHKLPKILKIIIYVLFLLLAFLAGMASEQIGILSIISLISINIFIIYKRNVQRDSTKFLILLNIALLFFIAGWLALYLSPGHAKRASLAVFDGIYMSLSQILSLDFMQLMKRIAKTMMAFKNNILLFFSIPLIYFLCVKKVNVKNIAIFAILTIIVLVLNNNLKIAGVRAFWILHIFVLFIALFILAKRELSLQTRQNGYFYVALLLLFLAFCMCMASTIQFISLPHRARLGDSMILIAMVALLFDRFANKHFQRLIVAICLAYGVFVTFAFIEYRIKWDRMLNFVEKQKQSGETHIVIDDIFHSRYKNLMNWGNPGKEPNEWPNTTYAQYFGVESFSVKPSDK